MIEPQTAVAIFMRAHRATRRRPQQAAPRRRFRHPFAGDHFAQTVAIQNPERARLGRKQKLRVHVRFAIRRRHRFKLPPVPPRNFIFRARPDFSTRICHQLINLAACQPAIVWQCFEFARRELQNMSVARQKPQFAIGIRALKNRPRVRRHHHVPRRAGFGRIARQHFTKLRHEHDQIGRG